MRFWYKLTDANLWEDHFMNGQDFEIPVYEETPEIVEDFYTNEYSDWWQVSCWGRIEFKDADDARTDLIADLGDSLYCRLHDC